MTFVMHKTSFWVFILIWVLAACSRESEQPPEHVGQVQATWKLICVGDGYTAGVGVEPNEAYPAQLSAMLSGKGTSVKVVNAAIKGESVADFGERMDWLLQQRFDAMLLVYDMEQMGDTSAAEGRWEDWAGVLERIKAVQSHATIWIGTDKPQPWKDMLNAWPEGRGAKIRVVDLSLSRAGMWSEDGRYPSKKGHAVLARRLAGIFSPLLSSD